jgi:hypothetical protein
MKMPMPESDHSESAMISCPACDMWAHWGAVRPHIHSTEDPEHNEVAENIDDYLGEHPHSLS